MLIQMLASAVETEGLLDEIERRFGHIEGFRILLLPVEASIPRLDTADSADAKAEQTDVEKTSGAKAYRISREELYADIEGATGLSWVFMVMIILSSVVAFTSFTRLKQKETRKPCINLAS